MMTNQNFATVMGTFGPYLYMLVIHQWRRERAASGGTGGGLINILRGLYIIQKDHGRVCETSC